MMCITEIVLVIVMRTDRNVFNCHAKPHLNSFDWKTIFCIRKSNYFALQNENLGAVIHEICHTEQKTGFSLCKIYIWLNMTWIFLFNFHLWNHSTSLKWHTTRRDYPAKGVKMDLLFHKCTEQVTYRHFVFLRTCNSLIWCYSYAVMFDILCYSYWWSTNIWRGLMTLSQHQSTEQHTAIHTCTKAHTS